MGSVKDEEQHASTNGATENVKVTMSYEKDMDITKMANVSNQRRMGDDYIALTFMLTPWR